MSEKIGTDAKALKEALQFRISQHMSATYGAGAVAVHRRVPAIHSVEQLKAQTIDVATLKTAVFIQSPSTAGVWVDMPGCSIQRNHELLVRCFRPWVDTDAADGEWDDFVDDLHLFLSGEEMIRIVPLPDTRVGAWSVTDRLPSPELPGLWFHATLAPEEYLNAPDDTTA